MIEQIVSINNIWAIIVCYYPNLLKLDILCNTLKQNGINLILINNSKDISLCEFKEKYLCSTIDLLENEGIARAQNIGIDYALNNRADFVFFFDQDSVINENLISNLIMHLSKDEIKVVTPVYVDEETNFVFPLTVINKFGVLKQISISNLLESFRIDVSISSGTATTSKTIEYVGKMDEDFFIDYVDTEWFLRCKEKNVPVFAISSAVMKHSIGNKNVKLGPFRIFVHNPIRSYYQIRNSFIFLRKKNVPLFLAFKEFLSVLLHQFLLLFFVKNKFEYFKYYLIAIFDGFLNKKGKKIFTK